MADPEKGRSYLDAPEGIVFSAGAGEQRCFIARQTLVTYFGALERAPDKRIDSLRAFDQAALFIKSVAAKLLSKRRGFARQPLVVTAHAVHAAAKPEGAKRRGARSAPAAGSDASAR